MKDNEKKPEEKKGTSESVLKEEPKTAKETRPFEKKMRKNGFNFGDLFLGIFLVFLGIVLLGKSTGWYEINFGVNLWQIWPLLIIFIGLSLLSRGRWSSFIITMVVTIIVIAIVGFMMFFGTCPKSGKISKNIEDISIKKEPGVNSALIRVETGAGRLKIDGGGQDLVSGEFKSDFLALNIESEVEGDIQKITFRTTGSWRGIGTPVNDLNLSINPDIPVEIELATGAVDMDIDLSEVTAKFVDINSGASSLELVMGDKVSSSIVKINSGASSIDITLPRTVGARLTIDAALTSKNLNDFKKLDSNIYESYNYDAVDKIIDIDLNVGASSINIDWK